MNNETTIKGQVKVDILDHQGRVVREGRWQPNLILDRGLNKLADTLFCDLFRFAVKGNHLDDGGLPIAMKEIVATSNSYTLTADAGGATGTLTRTAGTRDFVAGDSGMLVRCAVTSGVGKGSECIITDIVSTSVVGVRQVGNVNALAPYTSKDIVIFKTNTTGMTGEVDRTGSYSETTGENGTTRKGTQMTHKRTLIFDQEPEAVESFTGLFATWDATTLHVTKTTSTDTRVFASTDVGSYLQFADGQFCQIRAFVSSTVVAVDRPPRPHQPVVAAHLNSIYGHNKYTHIGFSESGVANDPLNILIRLESTSGASSPVIVLGNNPELTGQQVKVTYQMQVAFGPGTITSKVAPFSDPNSVMGSGGNGGSYVLEALGASTIDPSTGETDNSSAALEPSGTGTAALSNVSTALKALTATSTAPPDRSLGAALAPLVPQEYTADAFSRVFTAVFDVGVGTANNWRCMGIFDESANNFVWTYLFSHNRIKPSTYELILNFRKTWNRDLS